MKVFHSFLSFFCCLTGFNDANIRRKFIKSFFPSFLIYNFFLLVLLLFLRNERKKEWMEIKHMVRDSFLIVDLMNSWRTEQEKKKEEEEGWKKFFNECIVLHHSLSLTHT